MDINCKNLPFGRTVSTLVSYLKKNKVETLHLYNIHEFIIKGSLENYVKKYHKLIRGQKSNIRKKLQGTVKSIVRRMIKGMRLNEIVKIKLYEEEYSSTQSIQLTELKQVQTPLLKGFKLRELVQNL
jgi:coproporphyrinogen III oxidase-like Fe-S oxidoreductase